MEIDTDQTYISIINRIIQDVPLSLLVFDKIHLFNDIAGGAGHTTNPRTFVRGGACRVSKKLLPPPFMEAPQGGLSCPSGNSPSGGRAKRGRRGVRRVAKCLQRAQNISKIFSFRLNVSRTGTDTAAAFGGAPHQSSPGSEEPGDDSFSPRGEALSVIRRFPGNGIK